jgi:phosphoribosylformylglycinamidine cyclo-ligase
LAGFAVGAVEKSRIINGRTIEPGDVVLGLASSGAHSNGYSLVRRVIERAHGSLASPRLRDDFHGRSFADAVMAPTRIYVKPMLELMQHLPVKGVAHITGGGLVENVPRILGESLQAVLYRDAWKMPPFEWLQQQTQIADAEMHRVFNCGIGMVAVVAADDAGEAITLVGLGTVTPLQIMIVRRVPRRPRCADMTQGPGARPDRLSVCDSLWDSRVLRHGA